MPALTYTGDFRAGRSRRAAWMLLGAVVAASSGRLPAADAAPTAGHVYPIRGEVLAIDPRHSTITLAHEAVPGLMPAMTMEFPVDHGDLTVARVGGRIRGELAQTGSDWRLRGLWPDEAGPAAKISQSAAELAANTAELSRLGLDSRQPGDAIPSFELYDQDGRVVSIDRFRGKRTLLNFIYTRCPIATMCPASTAKMMVVQRAARAAGITDLELISVTLDPEHDTPGVLRDYADQRGIDTSNFSFLTGPDVTVESLLRQMGVSRTFDAGVLKHSLATLLIDASGTIVQRVDGSSWQPADFLATLQGH